MIFFLLMACFSVVPKPFAAETLHEFKVKAGYLLNIPMFADWSPSAETCGSFTIGIIGETPLHSALENMQVKRIKRRPVVVRKVRDISETSCCQVLFIAASERYRLQQLLPEAHRRGIMTISDMRGFIKLGGMVSLVMVNDRVTYDLNLVAARSASISFSSQLMKLANDVTD